MAQKHSGRGNNFAGNNYGRRIKMGDNGHYYESIINDVSQIKDAVSKWWEEKEQKELLVVVLCECLPQIKKVAELVSIQSYFGNKCEEWKPFGDKTIVELLKDFKDLVTYDVQCIICNKIDVDDIFFWVNWEDNHLHKIIVITDGLVLTKDKESFSISIDHRNKIGGILVPLHEDIGRDIKDYIRNNFKNKYPRMCARSSGKLGVSYSNIEIEVQTEIKFITTLQNLASYIGIYSNPKGLFKDMNKAGLQELKSDGL